MPNQILLDNWTLQEISHLSQLGLSNEETGKLIIDYENDLHTYEKISHGLTQIQSLFAFLQNLVLRETIITDNRFIHVWANDNLLAQLERDNIIKVHYFKEEKIAEVRKAIVNQLCVTSTLKTTQSLNEQSWNTSKTLYNSFESQIIWGGAGMLARGHVYDTYYLPHPLREYALKQSPIAKRDAFTETLSFISTNQTKLLYFNYDESEALHTRFLLPTFISTIIEESNDFNDLFNVALQLRDQYQDLREWLKQFQEALDSDGVKSISKHNRILKSIQKNIEDKYSPDKFGSLDLSFDLFSFSPSISISPSFHKLRNKIGIRSTINDLIISKAGYSSIKKLFRLLGEENSKLGKEVYDEILLNYTKRKT